MAPLSTQTYSQQYYEKELQHIHDLISQIEKTLLDPDRDPSEKEVQQVCMKISQIIEGARALHGQVAFDYS